MGNGIILHKYAMFIIFLYDNSDKVHCEQIIEIYLVLSASKGLNLPLHSWVLSSPLIPCTIREFSITKRSSEKNSHFMVTTLSTLSPTT
jgi:hypothetical protein